MISQNIRQIQVINCLNMVNIYLRYALIGLIEQYLRHTLDGYAERNDRVFTGARSSRMAAVRAQRAEHSITGLTEQQLLYNMFKNV